MAQILWTEKGLRQLESIRSYLETNNPFHSDRYITRMLRRIGLLGSFPESGELQPQYRGGNIRQIIFGNYRIIFQSSTQAVIILAIQHAAVFGDPDLSETE